jgi:hypothetical protein
MTIKRMASSAIAPSTHHRGLVVVVVVSVCVCLVVEEVLLCAGGLLCVVVVVLVFWASALRANGARPRVKAKAIALIRFVRLKDFTAGFSFSKQIRNEEKLPSYSKQLNTIHISLNRAL